MTQQKITRRPQAILFDWDNTLVDSWVAIADALNLTRSTYGLETWTVDEARVKSAHALRDSFPEWFGGEWEKARDIFYARYNAVHAQLVRPMTGVAELLAFLHEKKIPLGIISTKKNILLRGEVKNLGWDLYFQAIVGSMDAPKDKPDPAPVMMALSQMGIEWNSSCVWFVGDSHTDVECALRSGCIPILIGSKEEAVRLGIKGSFSDCITMKNTLYSCS
ncbi:MAG: HAD family hydrolase [Proteobacteria bacterium]|jgi:phosphoglycolate phosphatase|nr:HAD family hydrolase [Alphaproteobacteria bacterium]NCC02715.1 HAD family hydrolase [Pseudomonadota bacterium]